MRLIISWATMSMSSELPKLMKMIYLIASVINIADVSDEDHDLDAIDNTQLSEF
jgi:hypothetical protein